MHDYHMPTKTISLEIDAYERLKHAKRSPRESFSEVVRRAIFPEESIRGKELRERTFGRTQFLSEEALSAIEQADRSDPPPEDPSL
jgi:predicted CopG family antitoxin